MKSDGTECQPPPLPTTPLPSDPTRTPHSVAAPTSQPALAPALFRARERYQILNEHGRGGLGRVSRAHDRELGRDVAIKELISRTSTSEVRFLREAMITARLEHPSIVPMYEAGRWLDGTPYYAMKLVSGRPLRDLIAERTTVDQRIGLLHHVIAVADAIAYAHGRNIIHRDLKPANVIVGDFGETIVIDWGLAKDLSSSAEEAAAAGTHSGSPNDVGLTAAGAVLGTPTYMAPEQERGEHVDQRADVFAIGAMLWELCSLQKVPPNNLRHRHCLLRNAGIDQDLAVIIDKALDPDPSRRYPDSGALAADLKAFKSGARISARSYSLLAMLTHWTRRHSALALSMLIAAVIGIAGAVFYIRNIAAERDRADTALDDARRQAQRATIANARSLLERDPTQAWDSIASLTDSTEEITLLRARIKAAGVADITLPLPTRLDGVALTPSGSHLLVSTLDRSLFDIDPKAHTIRHLADGMTEPAILAVTDTDAFVVRKTEHLTLTRISLASGQLEDLVDLVQLPESMVATEAGVFWQYLGGTVQQLQPDHSVRTLAENVSQSFAVNSELVTCDKMHTLRIQELGRSARSLGHCMDTWMFVDGSNGFVVPVDSKHVGVYQGGRLRFMLFEKGPRYLGFSETGLISVVSNLGEGAFGLPTMDSFREIRLGQRALGTHARGSFALWSFHDGSVKVLDTTTGREWSIRAHSTGISCAYLLPPGDRIVTCGRSEIRIWTLPRVAPTLAADLPSRAFNIAFDENRTALFDGGDGDVYALRREDSSAVLVHKHALLSFGVAWCDGRACSAGWDGRILCSSLESGATETVATFEIATRWLGGRDGHCFAAVSSGGIYDVRSASTPIYRHDREPYRLAISRDGAQLASTDWGGAVKIWDLKSGRLIADIAQLHTGLVVNAIWLDDGRLVTAGYDGFVRLLDAHFKVIQSWYLGSAVRYVAAANETIHAALINGTLWDISLTTYIKRSLSLGVTFTALSVSSDGAFVATGTDDGELFLIDAQHRIAVQRFRQGAVRSVAFESDRTVLSCAPDNRMMRLTFQF